VPIGLTEIFVDDRGEARNFYAEVLGLQIKTDALTTTPPAGSRWYPLRTRREPSCCWRR
jgi:predicted enzyme related to lactoylglutathione lyase